MGSLPDNGDDAVYFSLLRFLHDASVPEGSLRGALARPGQHLCSRGNDRGCSGPGDSGLPAYLDGFWGLNCAAPSLPAGGHVARMTSPLAKPLRILHGRIPEDLIDGNLISPVVLLA